jgi:hypothetical protein
MVYDCADSFQDKHNLVSLQIINHFDIASMVPNGGMVSYERLADQCGLPEARLAKILRQAMTNGIFYEPQVGFVAHTPLSRTIPELHSLLKYQLEVCLPSSLRLLQSLKPDEGCGKSAFQLAHGTDQTWWDYAESSESWTKTYGQYQALITSGGAHDVSYVVKGVDWDQFGEALVVDVSIHFPSTSFKRLLTSPRSAAQTAS